MYKRVLLLVSVQRWEWEARGHGQWKCWGGRGCAWTRQWFFVLGWRRRTGNAVVSGDQWVLCEPQEEQSYAEGLPLPHPTGYACMVAASCVQIHPKWLQGAKPGFKREKRGMRGPFPHFSQSLSKSHPILPLQGAISTPSLGGEERLGQCRMSPGCLKRNKPKRSLL